MRLCQDALKIRICINSGNAQHIQSKVPNKYCLNDETTPINSRFYVAIGSPFPPHEGRTNEDCLEDVLELFTTLSSVMEMSKGVKGIRLAMGARIGQICSVAIRINDADQINIAGEAYDQARNLMSWTEDQTALKCTLYS